MSEVDPTYGLSLWATATGGAAIFLVLVWVASQVVRLSGGIVLSSMQLPLARFDSFLAKNVASWFGLNRKKPWQRWGQLGAMMMLLAGVGSLAPAILAIPALFVGLGGIIATFRRWSWDEADRAVGLRGDRKRIPGHEDYGDELVLALSAVFLFGPILIWRLTGMALFTAMPDGGLADYLLYFASETLESLPIVGNVEVFGYDNPSGVSAVLPSGGWVAFCIRMLLDLMVIGGLLKVAEVARRVSRKEDLRRQDEAIAQGGEDEAFAAMNVLGDLMTRGVVEAGERLQAIAMPGSGDVPQSIRRRLQATYVLEGAVTASTSGKHAMLAFLVETYASIALLPELNSSGFSQYFYFQAGRAHNEYAERLAETERTKAIDAAIDYLKQAIDAANTGPSGSYLPGNDARTPERSVSLSILAWELLGAQMIARADLSETETHHVYLVGALDAYRQAALLTPDLPERTVATSTGMAFALYKLALINLDAELNVTLEGLVSALEKAIGRIEEDKHTDQWAAARFVQIQIQALIAKRCRGMDGMRLAVEMERQTDFLLTKFADPAWPVSERARRNQQINMLIFQGNSLQVQAQICEETREAATITSQTLSIEAADSRAMRAIAHFRAAADAAASGELWDKWQSAMERAAELLEIHSAAHGYSEETAARSLEEINEAVRLRQSVLDKLSSSAQPWHWATRAVNLSRAMGESSHQSGTGLTAMASIDLALEAASIFDRLGYSEEADEARSLARTTADMRGLKLDSNGS